jgi:hypothetical protein
MPVPSLPTLGTPPAPAPLRKIALEEHFGHPIVFMRDKDLIKQKRRTIRCQPTEP